MKTKLLICLLMASCTFSIAQKSDIIVRVKWKSKSYENKVEVYNTANDLLLTICDVSQCYSPTQLASHQVYGSKYDLGCVTNGNNYYLKLYDVANDGWHKGNVTVTVAGTTVVNDDGAGANTTGQIIYFNVSGGDATCNSLLDTDSDGVADYLDYDDDADGITDAVENLGEDRFECTLPSLDFENGVYDASASTSAEGTVGAVYRFGNAIQGYDVLMEVTELTNTSIANIDNDTVDNPTYLQTELNFSGTGTPGASFKFTIVYSGTTIASTEIFRVNGITWDCDGTASLKESVIYYNPAAYGIENPSDLDIVDLGSNNIEITSGEITVNGFSTLPWLRAYYQFIGNSFSMRMQAYKTSSGSTMRQFGMSFTQCAFLDFNANSLIIVKGEDFDGDGKYNHLDLDSDDDGIPDNVESQTTLGYVAPSMTVDSSTGIDLVYGAGIDVVNTDNDIYPDILDLDSDNDGFLDIEENGMADAIVLFADNDDDGLDNLFEGTNLNDNLDVNDEINNPSSSILPDADGDLYSGGDLDYRDLFNTNPPSSAILDFDGVDDYLSTDSFIEGLDKVSIMAWVLSDSNNSGFTTIAGEDESCKIYLKNGNIPYFSIRTGGNTTKVISADPINFDEWHHISGTYSNATGYLNIYIDGVLENSMDTGITAAKIESTASGIDAFEIGRVSSDVVDREYFKGAIDEVRVFDIDLTADQIQRMVYQEIQNNGGNVQGVIVPKDLVDISSGNTISWANLIAYYPMTDIKNSTTTDYSGQNNTLTLNYITTAEAQTAPMPYKTKSDGDWSHQNTWLHGNVWDIENISNNKDWSIVKVQNNVTTSNSHKNLGLIIDSNKKLTVNGDNEINNSWYLELNGTIDLEGESQLVQGADSELATSSAGTIERDQQGTADLYTYNYWAAPVGISNTISNNNSYKMTDVLNDGTNPAAPTAINFLTSGYNGSPGPPIGIADYWIWKYANQLDDDYASWQHVRSTGSLAPGEGFTMKGPADTGGAISTEQNYVFIGKPNNGDITLTLSAGNDYLVGNPYASAIDADEFILDNINDGLGRATSNIIDGALYFWEHFASSTHNLREYQGGYGTYTLMGGTKAISNDIRINATGVSGIKTPQRYIPVGQGFFVVSNTGGLVTFKNSQRIFKTEASSPSVFMRTNNSKENTNFPAPPIGDEDTRQKIRLMLDSPKGYHRQLLLGADLNATNSFDMGYDAKLIEDNKEDMFWNLEEKKCIIQAIKNFNDNNVFPLGLITNQAGITTIKIDELENISESIDIFIYDKELNIFHDLNLYPYEINLPIGDYLNKFEIVLHNKNLSTKDSATSSIDVHYANDIKSIVLVNPTLKEIYSIELLNILGQSMHTIEDITSSNYLEYKVNSLSAGTYIIKLETDEGVLSKKVIVE